jgi:diguanylate cyclase (GGDEF)-like protein
LGLEPCAREGCLAQRAMSLGRPIRMDEVSSSRSDLRVNWVAIPIVDEEHISEACIEVYRDVTAESRMQENYKGLLDRERRRNEILQREVQKRTGELNRANEALSRALEQVTTLARTDPLTMLPNRRAFDEAIDKELRRSLRFRRPLSLIMIDLDHFKQVNDKLGHQAGDETLKTLARLLEQVLRSVDTVARIGGEEFAVVLPETSLEDALAVAGRLCELQASQGINTTLSCGVACSPMHGATSDTLYASADKALYEAKHGGRNRAVAAPLT